MQRQGGWNFFYTHDGNKNVSDVVSFQQARGIAAHYEYAPFGAVTAATRNTNITAFDVRTLNPFRFSSEYADAALGLVYYNYRHYEPVTGRWLSRDSQAYASNLYRLLFNDANNRIDVFGLKEEIPFDKYLLDFIERMERHIGRKLTSDEKRWYLETLARGCIGIVSCNQEVWCVACGGDVVTGNKDPRIDPSKIKPKAHRD